jgi:hypothetical protein
MQPVISPPLNQYFNNYTGNNVIIIFVNSSPSFFGVSIINYGGPTKYPCMHAQQERQPSEENRNTLKV